jgi:hypothetical protein
MDEKSKMGDKDLHIKQLYDTAFAMYRYFHLDLWRGQKYYTTLNIAILSIAFGLISTLARLDSTSKISFLVPIPLFVLGFFVTLFGYSSFKEHRRNFLQAVWFKTAIEKIVEEQLTALLKESGIPINRKERWRLTPVYSLKDDDRDRLLNCRHLWIEHNILRNRGISFHFRLLHFVFIGLNVAGIVMSVYFFI